MKTFSPFLKQLPFLFILVFLISGNAIGQTVKWSTYLNSTGKDQMVDMTRDANGDIYVLGYTNADSFQVTTGAAEPHLNYPEQKLTISKLSGVTGNLLWSSYIGGDADTVKPVQLYWDTVSNSINIVASVLGYHFPVVNGHAKTPGENWSRVFVQIDAGSGNILLSTYVFNILTKSSNNDWSDFKVIFNSGYAYYFTQDSLSQKLLISKINLTNHQFDYEKTIGVSTGVIWSNSNIFDCTVAVNNNQVYIAGVTNATDYPTTPGAFQTAYPAGANLANFVTRLDENGNITFSTYANGFGKFNNYYGNGGLLSNYNTINLIAVTGNEISLVSFFDSSMVVSPGGIAFSYNFNNIRANYGLLKLNTMDGSEKYFTYLYGENAFLRGVKYKGDELVIYGTTTNTQLPVTSNAFQSYFPLNGNLLYGMDDYILHYNASNQLVFCSYLGGLKGENIIDAVIANDNLVIFGTTTSLDFPVTYNATQANASVANGNNNKDLTLVKYNLSTRSIVYSSYFGSAGANTTGLLDVESSAYVNPANSMGVNRSCDIQGDNIFYHTYERAPTSTTKNFPTSSDAFQSSFLNPGNGTAHQHIAKINTNSGKLIYGSYFASMDSLGQEIPVAMVVDGDDIYFGGNAIHNYPVTAGAISTVFQNGGTDMYITKISLCSDNFIRDTLFPIHQSVCVGGLVDSIKGDAPRLLNPTTILRNGVVQPPLYLNINCVYQWQESTDSINWIDIPTAISKDYLPNPVNVQTFVRRISKQVSCNNTDTSTVSTILLNGNTAIKPDVGADGSYATCPGTSIVLGTAAQSGVTYQWQPAVGLNVSNTAQVNFNETVSGSYTYVLFAHAPNGCIATDTATVYNYQADAGSDKVLCQGRTPQIGGSPLAGWPGITYNWSSSSGLSCTDCPQPVVSLPGTYTITVNLPLISGGTCTSVDTVVIGAADISANPAGPDKIVCNSTPVTIGTPRVPGYVYNWTPGLYISGMVDVDQPVFNQYYATLTLNKNPMIYVLTAINPVGCEVIDSVSVFVVDPYAGAPTCRPGRLGKADYTNGQATYQWVKLDPTNTFEMPVGPGELSSTTVSDPIALASATITSSINYRVKMTWNGVTCTSSNVLVGTNCTGIVCGPQSGCSYTKIGFTSTSGCPTVVGFDSVTLFVMSPSSDYTYSWYPSTGLNTTTGTIVKTGINTSMVYTLVATNILDTSLYCIDTFKVNRINISHPAFSAPDQNVCKNAIANIGQTAIVGLTYNWTSSLSDGATVSTVSNPLITGTQDINYFVKVVDTVTSCYALDTVMIHVPQISANAGSDRQSCSGGGFTIGTQAVSGLVYHWTPSTNLDNPDLAEPTILSNSSDIAYLLQVTDPLSGCFVKDTINITHTNNPTLSALPQVRSICVGNVNPVFLGNPTLSGVSYSWSPGGSLNDSTLAQPYANPSQTTTYTLTAQFPGGCSTPVVQSVQLVVNPLPTAVITSTTNCSGTQLSASPANYSYLWTPYVGLNNYYSYNTLSTTTVPIDYTVSIYNYSTGCSNTQTVHVDPLFIVNAGDDQSICYGQSIQLGTPAITGVTYSWSPSYGLNNSNIAQPTTLPTLAPGTYYFTVTASKNGCNKTDNVTVVVNPVPSSGLSSGITVCKNSTVQIGVTPVTGLKYSWVPALFLSDSIISQPYVTPAQTTTYHLYTRNELSGCFSVATTTVTVSNAGTPVVNASANNSACAGLPTQLTSNVTGSGSFRYAWTPDINFISSRFISNPVVYPSQNITYQVTVTNNDNGCSNSALAKVYLQDNCNTTTPVTWLDFNLEQKPTTVLLNWTVGMEQNNKEFWVERSIDGIHWTSISVQTSRGNTSSPRTYYATDNDIISGLVFYRIRQVDLDGRSKLSITRTTRRVVTEKIDWVVYPNPTKEWLQIDYLYAGNKPAAKLMLYTSEGRLVKQTDMHQLSATISVAEFPAGMYFLKLIDNNGMVTTRKVIVSR